MALLVLSSVLTVGAMTVASDQESWSGIGSVFGLFISPAFLLKYIQFACVAAGATGLGILFFFFVWQAGGRPGDPAYHLIVRRTGLRLAIASVLIQPMLIVLNVVALPNQDLSAGLFGLAGASLILFFLTAQFLYAYGKHAEGGYIAYAFYTLGVAFLLLFTADQVAVSNATRPHAARLAVAYDRATEEMKARLGIAMKTMSGEDIYNAKCSACHLFDQKKVGPPYNVVIPKYAGRQGEADQVRPEPGEGRPRLPAHAQPGAEAGRSRFDRDLPAVEGRGSGEAAGHGSGRFDKMTPAGTYRAAFGSRLGRASDYLALTKPGLTATSVATAVFGALLGSGGAENGAVALHVLAGSALLGGGAIALNQVIERERDAAMKRTFKRPVAAGRISPASASLFGGILAGSGLLWLLAFTHPLAAILGAVTLALYLLVYTPLKTVTPYSTLVGAVPGALPPLIGWSAATGTVSVEGWVLFAILFFWQIPHFLALSWMYREDYEKGGYRFLPAIDGPGYLTAAQMVLYSVALLGAAALPFFFGMAGGWYRGGFDSCLGHLCHPVPDVPFRAGQASGPVRSSSGRWPTFPALRLVWWADLLI